MLIWGGLRGGVALALALALPDEVPASDTIIAATGGVVLSTLLLNATTIRALVHWLGLDRVSRSDLYLGAAARLLAIEAARARLAGLDFHDDVLDAHLRLAEVEAIVSSSVQPSVALSLGSIHWWTRPTMGDSSSLFRRLM